MNRKVKGRPYKKHRQEDYWEMLGKDKDTLLAHLPAMISVEHERQPYPPAKLALAEMGCESCSRLRVFACDSRWFFAPLMSCKWMSDAYARVAPLGSRLFKDAESSQNWREEPRLWLAHWIHHCVRAESHAQFAMRSGLACWFAAESELHRLRGELMIRDDPEIMKDESQELEVAASQLDLESAHKGRITFVLFISGMVLVCIALLAGIFWLDDKFIRPLMLRISMPTWWARILQNPWARLILNFFLGER